MTPDPRHDVALSRERAGVLLVDIQERLLAAMPEEAGQRVVRNAQLLIAAAARLELPLVITQQYPKGLGPTVAALESALEAHRPSVVHRFDKLEFSVAAVPDVYAAIAGNRNRNQWIVAGMEAHVCVYQTARDLVARGLTAHVCTDAIASRSKANFRTALGLYERVGAIATSTETCVFDLLHRAGTEEFKALSKAIK
ncbi:MAG TPA: isochorismatase family protein [Kofleriaceae bacterium]|nr:isochorismatase family protein [Kofleriaceae bacterium]